MGIALEYVLRVSLVMERQVEYAITLVLQSLS